MGKAFCDLSWLHTHCFESGRKSQLVMCVDNSQYYWEISTEIIVGVMIEAILGHTRAKPWSGLRAAKANVDEHTIGRTARWTRLSRSASCWACSAIDTK